MKKLLLKILAIPLIIFLLWTVPYIFKFVSWIIEIDNTEFEFPGWIDLIISSASGIIAYTFTGVIFDFFGNYDKESMSTIKNIIGIIIGFVIGFIIHIFIDYWYITVSIMALVAIVVICYVVRNKEAD